jgi:hypothetical protein
MTGIGTDSISTPIDNTSTGICTCIDGIGIGTSIGIGIVYG